MKSTDVAHKYGFSEYDVEQYIKECADFPFKENIFGTIIFSDDVDIEAFLQPLLLKRKEEINRRLYEQKKEQEELDKQEYIRQQKEQEELDRQEYIRQQKEAFERKQKEEQYHLRIGNLKERNIDGYYEYKVISLSDVSGLFKKNSGRVDIETMSQVLNDLGLDGWHLVTAYSNELGKNALSGGVGGALLGVNSTVDENILIFERFVKI